MNVPEAKRSKNIYVSDDFITSVKKAFNKGKAEKLPPNSFYPLYIGYDLLEQMETNDNQIIWGRRGTGKTHLLRAFEQYINDDPNKLEMCFYISCDESKFETPKDIKFTNDYEKMKYCARETYKSLMYDLFDQIIERYEDILKSKNEYSKKGEKEKRKIKSSIDNCLTSILENIITGIPRVVETTTSMHQENSKEKTNTKEFGIEGSAQVKKELPTMKLFFNFFKKRNVKISNNIQTDKSLTYEFSFLELKNSINRLVKELGINTLYICIDEIWLIDDKHTISFQPLFFEYLKQTIFGLSNVGVKIASIRETTKLNSKNSMINSYGIQAGHDIIELANLDSMQYSDDEVTDRFIEIITNRINYFSDEREKGSNIYEKDFIIKTIFKDKRYFKSLIALSHGIPRMFLNILRNSLVKINYDLSHNYLHIYLISNTVISIFMNEKRSNMPMNENSLYNIINNYITNNKKFFFLLSSEHAKRSRIEINNLIYSEIIHRIPSNLTPSNIMDNYKAYFVDSGKYFATIQENDNKNFKKFLEEFSLSLPEDLKSDYKKYIINLDKIQNNFIECPDCGAAFSVDHPVYKKHHCCVVCSFNLKRNDK